MKTLLVKVGKAVAMVFAVVVLLLLSHASMLFIEWVAAMNWFQVVKTVLLWGCSISAVGGILFVVVPMIIKDRRDAAEMAAGWDRRRREEKETFSIWDGQQQGPFTREQICILLERGSLSAGTLVWHGNAWKKPQEVGIHNEAPSSNEVPGWAG